MDTVVPEFVFRSTNFCVPENLVFSALNECDFLYIKQCFSSKYCIKEKKLLRCNNKDFLYKSVDIHTPPKWIWSSCLIPSFKECVYETQKNEKFFACFLHHLEYVQLMYSISLISEK